MPAQCEAGGAAQPRTKGLSGRRVRLGSSGLGAAAALRALSRRRRAAAARAGGAVRQRGRQRRCKGRRLRPVRGHARHILHSHLQQLLLGAGHSHLQARHKGRHIGPPARQPGHRLRRATEADRGRARRRASAEGPSSRAAPGTAAAAA